MWATLQLLVDCGCRIIVHILKKMIQVLNTNVIALELSSRRNCEYLCGMKYSYQTSLLCPDVKYPIHFDSLYSDNMYSFPGSNVNLSYS